MLKTSLITLLTASIALAATVSIGSASETTVRDHRTKTTVRDHRTVRSHEVVTVQQGKYDCSFGLIKLYKMGYTPISATNCGGAIFRFTAMDGTVLLHATMSSHTAQMRISMAGIVAPNN